jgi:hypothetical protein
MLLRLQVPEDFFGVLLARYTSRVQRGEASVRWGYSWEREASDTVDKIVLNKAIDIFSRQFCLLPPAGKVAPQGLQERLDREPRAQYNKARRDSCAERMQA